MSDSKEVYAFPEGTLYVWQGGTSAIATYAENIEITVEDTIRKFLDMTTGVGFAPRSYYVQTDRNVRMNVGQMTLGVGTFNLMNSAVNLSATMNFTAFDASMKFTLWSARGTNFQLLSRDGQVCRTTLSLIAPDISGV